MIGCDPGSTDFWDPKKSSLQDNLFAVVEKLVQTAAWQSTIHGQSMDNLLTGFMLGKILYPKIFGVCAFFSEYEQLWD